MYMFTYKGVVTIMYAWLASREAFVPCLLLKVSSEGGAALHQFGREFHLFLLSHFYSCKCKATLAKFLKVL